MNYFLLLLLGLSYLGQVCPLKVLIIPPDYGYNSRLFTMGTMGKIISDGGFDVSMLLNSKVYEKYTPPKEVKVISYEMPKGKPVRFLTDQSVFDEIKSQTQTFLGSFKLPQLWADIQGPFCEALVSNSQKMAKLKEDNYDVIIVDNVCDCCRVMVDYLNKPFIVYSGFGFMTMFDIFYPKLTSFVCDPVTSCSSDKMDFKERMVNFVMGALAMVRTSPSHVLFDEYRMKYSINASLRSSDSFKRGVVLAHANFILNYPRPVMPHVITISGLFHKPSEPLPTDLQKLIEGPQYDSVVVVSFGTYIPTFDKEKARIMAKVFAQLPALVIWRYKGLDLENMPSNIHLVGWFPQAGVVQHPKVRLFITHCGMASTYEAIYNGLPVIAMPFISDQLYNAELLVERLKMGRKTTLNELTEDTFAEIVNDVFNSKTFEANSKKVKDMMNFKMVEPEKKLWYWVEHVARFGTGHLISEPVHELNIFQLYSVDVILFLLFMIWLIIGVIIVAIRCCFLFCKWGKQSREHKLKKDR